MGGAVWYFLSSGGAVVLLSLAAVCVLLFPRAAAARRCAIAVALFYWITSTEIVPDTIRQVMSSGYRPLTHADASAGHTAIVLLGSGSLRFRDWDDNQMSVVDPIGASRLLEAARLFRLLNADYILSSGGLAVASDRTRPAGQTMAEALVTLGIPKDRILVETESRTTRDEAVVIKDLLSAHPVDRVVLVTSQFHMRRSIGTFKAVGINVVPAIAREPQGFDAGWEKLVPSDKGLKDSAMAAHEIFGIVVYALRGWYRF